MSSGNIRIINKIPLDGQEINLSDLQKTLPQIIKDTLGDVEVIPSTPNIYERLPLPPQVNFQPEVESKTSYPQVNFEPEVESKSGYREATSTRYPKVNFEPEVESKSGYREATSTRYPKVNFEPEVESKSGYREATSTRYPKVNFEPEVESKSGYREATSTRYPQADFEPEVESKTKCSQVKISPEVESKSSYREATSARFPSRKFLSEDVLLPETEPIKVRSIVQPVKKEIYKRNGSYETPKSSVENLTAKSSCQLESTRGSKRISEDVLVNKELPMSPVRIYSSKNPSVEKLIIPPNVKSRLQSEEIEPFEVEDLYEEPFYEEIVEEIYETPMIESKYNSDFGMNDLLNLLHKNGYNVVGKLYEAGYPKFLMVKTMYGDNIFVYVDSDEYKAVFPKLNVKYLPKDCFDLKNSSIKEFISQEIKTGCLKCASYPICGVAFVSDFHISVTKRDSSFNNEEIRYIENIYTIDGMYNINMSGVSVGSGILTFPIITLMDALNNRNCLYVISQLNRDLTKNAMNNLHCFNNDILRSINELKSTNESISRYIYTLESNYEQNINKLSSIYNNPNVDNCVKEDVLVRINQLKDLRIKAIREIAKLLESERYLSINVNQVGNTMLNLVKETDCLLKQLNC